MTEYPNRFPPTGYTSKKCLLSEAKDKKIPWKLLDLPEELKDQCIAYCIREGDTYRIGRPSKNAIIFLFPNGAVYDISMLLHGGYCWRTISPESLEWIKKRTTHHD